MSRPRIALLHYASAPTIGGVECLIANHARLLTQHGYAVQIVTGRGEPFADVCRKRFSLRFNLIAAIYNLELTSN
jgi:hypothetical protein